MEVTTGSSLSEFSKYWLLLQKAHEKEINAVTEEAERWKSLYETERDLVSSLQKQLNVEVERLQKLLNIAETKIAEKEAKIIEKDERISHLESLIKAKTAEKEEIVTNLESLIKKADTGSQPDTKNDTVTDNTGSLPNLKHDSTMTDNIGSQPNDINNSPPVQHIDEGSVNTSPASPSLLENINLLPLSTPSRDHSNNINHKWMKRKRRKRLKQTTLTQHQSMERKRQKLDHSIKVVPQTPYIDLNSGSSCEDEDPVLSDTSDGYASDDMNSQNCLTANQDHTFVPDSSQKQNITNQDNTYVDNPASQVCDLTSQNHVQTNNDFIPLVNSRRVNVHPDSSSTTSTHQSTEDQHMKDQREVKRSTPDPKYVEICRKKSDRKKLDAAPCHECAQWYADDDPKAVKQTCRHRFKYPPPNTPPAFWNISFPDSADTAES